MPRRERDEYEEEESYEEAEDDERDYDDEEEEEEDDNGRPTKRRKVPANPFIDVEAGVSDDEGEEEEEEAEEGFIDHSEEISRGGPRGPRPTGADLRLGEGRERKSQDYLTRLEERYAAYDDDEDEDEEMEDYEDDQIDTLGVGRGEIRGARMGGPMASRERRETDFPTVQDPKLFLVRCKQGKEKYAVATLLQKCLNLSRERDRSKRLQVTSALCVEGFKGFIYVEAFREAHVKQAVNGLGHVIYESGIKLVPLQEMADVLTTGKKAIDIKKGDWVRVKRGIYRGDIAQVWDVDEARGVASIKIVPRLNTNGTQPSVINMHNRPPQRLLNEEEVKDDAIKKKDQRSNVKFVIYQGKKFKDGYMFKLVNIKSLETKDIQPTIEELKMFQKPTGGDADIQLNNLAESFKKSFTFKKGDMVRVIDGELIGIKGIVHAVNGDSVTFIPRDKDKGKDGNRGYDGLLESPASQLQKYFEEGSFCKVISGKYEGEMGYIVSTERDTVVLYSDMKKKEMKVFVSDIQLASAAEDIHTKTGNFNLHDMIKIDNNTMGVIVKVEKEAFKVLDNNGTVKSLRLEEMGPKRNTREGYKMSDKNNNQFGVGESLRVVDGPFKGREGIAKQLFRAFVFIHARDILENSGIFVTRADFCEVRGNRMTQQGAAGNMPAPKTAPPRGAGRGIMFRGRSTHPMMDKTVRVKTGPFKGYIGMVRDVSDDTARVELHSRMKTISVKLSNLKEEGAENPVPIQQHSSSANYGSNRSNVRRYDDGGRTPLRPSFVDTPNPSYPETPRTPSHDRAWNPNAPNTPLHEWGRDERTVETPAATPIVTPSVATTPFASSMDTTQTPSFRAPITPGAGSYHHSSVTTPHETPMFNPTTPAAYSHDHHYRTPGVGYTNPTTPGVGFNPTTPGVHYAPTTPGVSMNTPTVNTPGGDMSTSAPRTPGNPYTTPGVNFNPTTPGMGYGGHPTTPGVGYNNPTTPGMNPITPGVGQGYGGGYNPTTPFSAPITPGANYSSSYGGGAGGGGYDSGYSSYDSASWVSQGMRVRIEGNTSYNRYRGYIKSVNQQAGTCTLSLEGADEQEEVVVNMKMEYIKPDTPRKDDRVIIIKPGEHRGREAYVIFSHEGSVAVRFTGENTPKTFAETEVVPLI